MNTRLLSLQLAKRFAKNPVHPLFQKIFLELNQLCYEHIDQFCSLLNTNSKKRSSSINSSSANKESTIGDVMQDDEAIAIYEKMFGDDYVPPKDYKSLQVHLWLIWCFFMNLTIHNDWLSTSLIVRAMSAALLITKQVTSFNRELIQITDKLRLDLNREEGKSFAYNTDERTAATISMAKKISKCPSMNNFVDKIIEKMQSDYDEKIGPKPYGKTKTRELAKPFFEK